MDTRTPADAEFGDRYASRQMARRQNPLRRVVKSFYVGHLLRFVRGRGLDVGCGAGQILERMPAGSVGIEVNPVLLDDLRARGLDVRPALPDPRRIDLSSVAGERFDTLVLSHVLEHFDHADRVLAQLLDDAAALGVDTLIVVVPGWVGYRSDDTHKTFVTSDYVEVAGLRLHAGFALQATRYFPGNAPWIGRLFPHHELMLVYRREAGKATSV